jgi:hypothetical protein
MKKIIDRLIVIYQKSHRSAHCRYIPSCSEYSRLAVRRYGVTKGLFLGLKRLMRCHPLGGWGYDPLPDISPKGSPQRRLSFFGRFIATLL